MHCPVETVGSPKTPPHPTPAFPFNGMAFPVTGRSHWMEWRSHLLGVPSYWAFPWPSGPWDEESGADLGGPGMGAPRHFLRPQRNLAMAWRRRQAMGTPSNWERLAIGKAISLDFRKRRGVLRKSHLIDPVFRKRNFLNPEPVM